MVANEEAVSAYTQDAGGGASTTDDLQKLADFKKADVPTESEFSAQKAKLLAVSCCLGFSLKAIRSQRGHTSTIGRSGAGVRLSVGVG